MQHLELIRQLAQVLYQQQNMVMSQVLLNYANMRWDKTYEMTIPWS